MRVVQSGARFLISHRNDQTGKRKFESTGLAKMFAGRIFVTSALYYKNLHNTKSVGKIRKS